MSRYQLAKPGQPVWQRTLLGVVDFSASLKLAVVLISLTALGLAWATFVESEFGTPAVHFGVYGSPLFSLLMLLLAINIFSAAAVRFPWKKHQTGFVITHIGLLVLLFGCLLTRRGWIDAQMPIFEEQQGYRAFTDDHHFELTVRSQDKPNEEQVIVVPFKTGPFNWNEYDTLFNAVHTDPDVAANFNGLEWTMDQLSLGLKNSLRATSGAAFKIAHRDRGVIYDSDQDSTGDIQGVKLELLDYYANSEIVAAPQVTLKMSLPAKTTFDEDGKPVEAKPRFQPITLVPRFIYPAYYPTGIGGSQLVGGGLLTYRTSSSPAETQAFLAGKPKGKLDETGQLILYAEGKSYHLDVKDLESKEDGEPTPLGDSGMSVALVRREANGSLDSSEGKQLGLGSSEGRRPLPGGPAVQLDVFRKQKNLGHLVLFADHPEFSIQRHTTGSELYGTYWVDQNNKTMQEIMSGQGGSRIDLLLGDDNETLYYRYWNRTEVAQLAELPTDGTQVDAFKMPIAQLRMYVDRLVPPASTKVAILPVPYSLEIEKSGRKEAAAKLRLTVGSGKEATVEEFWLASMPRSPVEQAPDEIHRGTVLGADKRVVVSMQPTDAFENVNFQVRLDKFHRKLDPGTDQAAFYGSTVDILTRKVKNKELAEPAVSEESKPEMLHEDIKIEMNIPFDVVDPVTGRKYRLFQESFGGPWGPNEKQYQDNISAANGRDQLYISYLTVNYDPGRAAKYLGCLLVCAGIFTMFYMRAYFFKPAGKQQADETVPPGMKLPPKEKKSAKDGKRKGKGKQKTPVPST